MTPIACDVIVVGAGAAGASVALHLAGRGKSVIVVDKAPLPRYKACGGAIPRPALDRLPFSVDKVVRAHPTAVRFTFPGQPDVDRPLPDRPVAMVMRDEFDALLLDRSGAEVLSGAPVTEVTELADAVVVRAGDRLLSARYLVGADGAASQVARRLGLRRHRLLGGTLEAEVPLDGRLGLRDRYGERAVFALGGLPWGYAWVFPKGDHLSVGIGRFRPGQIDLRAALAGEMERLGIPLDGVAVRGHPIPSYHPLRRWPLWYGLPQERLSTRRCLLVGDAAGLVDPLVGEGIRYAIASGRIAAEAIARDDLSGYEAAVWRGLGQDLATAGLVAGVFYHWPKGSYRLGVRNPATVGLFVDLLTQRIRYVGSGRRIVLATLRWAAGRNHTDTESRRIGS